ncbi:MAG TPA: MATE family efflux transporter [Clostridia bacterium]|nr:MATE family efflux transporter [Clostridia bacterium]
MATRIKDMTDGKPARLIVTFALPLMLGSVFQQTYTIVDSIVVGRVAGVEALAALGVSDWVNWMILGLVMGFAHGFTILISQRFGAEDYAGLRKTVAMCTILSGIIGVAMTVVGLSLAKPILRAMQTPDNIIDNAHLYISIYSLGFPMLTAYNVSSSILRGMGDSKTPLWAMIIASVINIILDIIFVVVFRLGVAGVAVATIMAQTFSFLYCLRAIKKLPILRMEPGDWKLDKGIIGHLLRLSIPMACQNAIIGAGGIVVQYVINGFGFVFVAGFTSTNRLYGLLEMAAMSFGFAMATFAGQNLGAGEYRRIREGVNSLVKIAIGTACAITLAAIAFGRRVLMLYITGDPGEIEAVVNVAYKYLFIMAAFLFILYLLHVYRSALQGMGDTVMPMVSGIVELVMRISTIILLPLLVGEIGLYFAEIAAWLGAVVVLMSAYYLRINRLENSSIPREGKAMPVNL